MKAFIAARGLNEIECPVCGTRLSSRVSRCPRYESADDQQRCQWQPGFWAQGRFWSTAVTEVELGPEEITQLKACSDLVVIDDKMFKLTKS